MPTDPFKSCVENAFTLGMENAFDQYPRGNPYPPETPESEAWEEGFAEGLAFIAMHG